MYFYYSCMKRTVRGNSGRREKEVRMLGGEAKLLKKMLGDNEKGLIT